MAKAQTHESSDREEKIKMGSEKGFGIVFGVVFLIIALWPLLHGNDVRIWSIVISAIFFGLAFTIPHVMRPLNIVWFKFGMLLAIIMTPIVMGLLYVVTFIPIGLIMQYIARKDLLRLKLDPGADSYWIKRSPPGPEPETMKNQF